MKLKEMEERLETIKNMDNIDDLKEQMELKDELAKQIEYASSLNKDLQQELNETRDISKRADLENSIKETEMQMSEKNVQVEQIKTLVEEVKNTRTLQQQEAKKQFVDELQEQQEKNQNRIEKKKIQIAEVSSIRQQILGNIEENKTVLKLKKPESKVYQAAEEENKKCIEDARNRNKRIKRLSREIEALESENKDIEKVLQEIELVGEKETENQEIKEQEDQMWEEYKKEQEEAEARKDEEIDLAYAEKEKQEALEDQKSFKPNTAVNPTRNSSSPQKALNSNYTVKNIQFTIEGNQPTYHAFIEDNNGNQIEDVSITGFDEIGVMDDEKANELYKNRNVYQASKFYDVNIDKLLKIVDGKYNTLALKQYQQMVREVELKPEQKMTKMLDINYDFSDLYQKPTEPANKEKIKKIKKLAKAGSNKKLVGYEKAPSIFKIIWTKISQKLLETSSKELEPKMEEITPERMKQDLEQLYDEPGFSIDEFVKDMPEEEANKYRSYRDSLKIKAQSKNEVQEKIGQNVSKIIDENKEKSNKENETEIGE